MLHLSGKTKKGKKQTILMTFHCFLYKDQDPWLFGACSPLSPLLWAPVCLTGLLSIQKPPTPTGPGVLTQAAHSAGPGCSVLSLHLLFSTQPSDLNSSPLPWQELPVAPGPRRSGAHFTLLHAPSWHSSQLTIMCLCL